MTSTDEYQERDVLLSVVVPPQTAPDVSSAEHVPANPRPSLPCARAIPAANYPPVPLRDTTICSPADVVLVTYPDCMMTVLAISCAEVVTKWNQTGHSAPLPVRLVLITHAFDYRGVTECVTMCHHSVTKWNQAGHFGIYPKLIRHVGSARSASRDSPIACLIYLPLPDAYRTTSLPRHYTHDSYGSLAPTEWALWSRT